MTLLEQVRQAVAARPSPGEASHPSDTHRALSASMRNVRRVLNASLRAAKRPRQGPALPVTLHGTSSGSTGATGTPAGSEGLGEEGGEGDVAATDSEGQLLHAVSCEWADAPR